MATTTARAQAGNVRRELLESREEMSRDVSRAVADAVQDPVLSAFGECFEGQLIPRIQASKLTPLTPCRRFVWHIALVYRCLSNW